MQGRSRFLESPAGGGPRSQLIAAGMSVDGDPDGQGSASAKPAPPAEQWDPVEVIEAPDKKILEEEAGETQQSQSTTQADERS